MIDLEIGQDHLMTGSGERHRLLRSLAHWAIDEPQGSPRRLCIDGPDGAGKTILADELAGLVSAQKRPVIRASIDGFHRPRAERLARYGDSPEGYYRDSFDYVTLRSALLDRLSSQGDLTFRRAVFDLRLDKEIPEVWETADPDAVLIFDGVFLLRPELRDLWDRSIYLHVEQNETLRRVIERDSAWMGSQEVVRDRYLQRYIPGQMLYLEEAAPQEAADVVIDNSDIASPRLLRPKRL